MTIGAVAAAELIGLLVGWLFYKITSRWFPPLHAILREIEEMSRESHPLRYPLDLRLRDLLGIR
ncbi:hypothetical protein [Planosporangium mesophilum]|jgi:hypothetical protein|nr:hypothetical protein [Planosporangium mesophilum]NJC81914.1 hypothetical protein [Planosporangium mesophilum]